MNESSLEYSSCIVRIWRAPATAPEAAAHDVMWLAQVEWLPAGTTHYFSSTAGLLAYLGRALTVDAIPTDAHDSAGITTDASLTIERSRK